jgi:hypothetical protein
VLFHLLAAWTLAAAVQAALPVRISYLYSLSDFNGTVPFGDVLLHVDRQRDEVYGIVGNSVRVFNSVGMEIYRFDHDLSAGRIFGLVAETSGDLLLLLWDTTGGAEDRHWWLARCDYRGTPLEVFEVSELPEDLSDFGPNQMLYQEGRILLVSRSQLQMIEIDPRGVFQDRWDLSEIIELDEPNAEIFGFSVDRADNLLFTIATQFRAYVVATDGLVRQFGTVGSAPGKFGIVAGIVADDNGYVLIADKLRHVVMVFSPELQFITEFSAAGRQDLLRPTELVMGAAGKFYVTQARSRGVAVYRLTPNRLAVAPPVGTSPGSGNRSDPP